MVRRGALQNRRKRSREFTHPRAAPMPERRTRGHLVEADDLFDAAVTIRCDRKDLSGQRFALVNAHDHVVVELTLLPMIDEIVSTESLAQRLEQISEHHGIGEGLKGELRHRAGFSTRSAAITRPGVVRRQKSGKFQNIHPFATALPVLAGRVYAGWLTP